MQTFSGIEYLKIDIANVYGLDRLSWNDRIFWTNDNEPNLEKIDAQAKHPILFRKAVRALRTVQNGDPTNHIMGLDATASGLQIMAVVTGCEQTARTVNLINTGHREDIYTWIADYMNQHISKLVDRDILKHPIMTFFYGSIATPKKVFGIGEDLKLFYDAMQENLPGAYGLMKFIQGFWNPHATHYRWTLPDMHRAIVPVTVVMQKELEIAEMDKMRFTYRTSICKSKRKGRALAANIVHSLDGWVVREMVRRAHSQGFWMAPIHDCFYASPLYMNQVRQNYVDILVHLNQLPAMKSIISEIAGRHVPFNQLSSDLYKQIANAEYALS